MEEHALCPAQRAVEALDKLFRQQGITGYKGIWMIDQTLKKARPQLKLRYYHNMLRACLSSNNTSFLIDYIYTQLADLVRNAPYTDDDLEILDSLMHIISLLKEQYPHYMANHLQNLIKNRVQKNEKGKEKIVKESCITNNTCPPVQIDVDIDALEAEYSKSENISFSTIEPFFEIIKDKGKCVDDFIINLGDFINSHHLTHPWIAAHCYISLFTCISAHNTPWLFVELMAKINEEFLPILSKNNAIATIIKNNVHEAPLVHGKKIILDPAKQEKHDPDDELGVTFLSDNTDDTNLNLVLLSDECALMPTNDVCLGNAFIIALDTNDQPQWYSQYDNQLYMMGKKQLTKYDLITFRPQHYQIPASYNIIGFCHTPVNNLPNTIKNFDMHGLYVLYSTYDQIKLGIFSPDKSYFLISDSKNNVFSFNLAKKHQYRGQKEVEKEEEDDDAGQLIACNSSLDSLFFLNNHKCLMKNNDTMQIVNLKKRKSKLTGYHSFNHAAMLNNMLLTVQNNRTLHIWDRSMKEHIVLSDNQKIKGLASFDDFAVIAYRDSLTIYDNYAGFINAPIETPIISIKKIENNLLVQCQDNKLLVYSIEQE